MLRDNRQIITGNRKWVGWGRVPGRKVGEKKGSRKTWETWVQMEFQAEVEGHLAGEESR